MDCVNKPHSMVGYYRVKMGATFMKSCLQAGETLVERTSGIVYSGLLQGGHLH